MLGIEAPFFLPNNPAVFTDQSGTSLMARFGGQLQKSDDNGTTWTPPGGRTGLISGGSNFASTQLALAAANAAGGTVVELGKGTINVTAAMFQNSDGVRIMGNGPGSTFFNIDDTAGMAGLDALTINSILSGGIEGVTFTSNGTPRAAGKMIKVLGRNNITATPAQRVDQYLIRDVNAEDQFDGLVVNDGPGLAGAWGGHLENCHWKGFGAGGTYVDINTPHGGQHKLLSCQFWGGNSLSDANRAICGVRYRGGADLEIKDVSSVYHRYGLLVDPAAQAANVMLVVMGDWDNNTRSSIAIIPTAGGQALDMEFIGGWGFTNLGLGYPCVDIHPDGASNADNGRILGGTYWANLLGVSLNATWGWQIQGANFSASTSGIQATGSAHHFLISGNVVGKVSSSVPVNGITIDALCDHYRVTANELSFCTGAPLTDTPGFLANRRDSTGNITL